MTCHELRSYLENRNDASSAASTCRTVPNAGDLLMLKRNCADACGPFAAVFRRYLLP